MKRRGEGHEAHDVHVKTYGILPGKTFNGLQNGRCQGAEGRKGAVWTLKVA